MKQNLSFLTLWRDGMSGWIMDKKNNPRFHPRKMWVSGVFVAKADKPQKNGGIKNSCDWPVRVEIPSLLRGYGKNTSLSRYAQHSWSCHCTLK
tara:strand:- start:916 stop:1194 length:279 start_codon:yes stop_codon:yes gene_type:complete